MTGERRAFEDLRVGDRFETPARAVGEGELVAFARACPRCGDRLRVIATIQDPAAVRVGRVFTGFLEDDEPDQTPPDFTLVLALLRELNQWLDGSRTYRSPLAMALAGNASLPPRDGYLWSDDQRLLFVLADPRRSATEFNRFFRIRHDDLVAERLHAAGHPLALRRGFDQDPGARSFAQGLGEAPGLGADPTFDQPAAFAEDADLAFLLVDVDANIVHGQPLLHAVWSAASGWR